MQILGYEILFFRVGFDIEYTIPFFMTIFPMPYLLLFVVLTEGFTTLAMQLVALRSAIPLVGSSIVLTSVVIGVILLALAVGYWL